MANNIAVSQLQMTQIVYTKMYVEAIGDLNKVEELWAPKFDFQGVEIVTGVTVIAADGEQDDPRNFMVILKFGIPNKTGKTVPYTIEIETNAWFNILGEISVDKRDNFVYVNGATMILGSVRETILTMTGRSAFGPLLIPTLRFLPKENNINAS